ncbi:unnamed protein product [Sphenostylis stenocarpa]|uniref:Uncharacterized protein n=1 Tax=Sphenostylis stenocarpa TaxID=92480 RepID=A0AA86VIL5_9FABA|nr:unnamed protein product [Sphenostylis stenocarpa]
MNNKMWHSSAILLLFLIALTIFIPPVLAMKKDKPLIPFLNPGPYYESRPQHVWGENTFNGWTTPMPPYGGSYPSNGYGWPQWVYNSSFKTAPRPLRPSFYRSRNKGTP